MKVINPTDSELNALFGVHVAGMTQNEYENHKSAQDDDNHIPPGVNFTASVDAVLPYLENWQWRYMAWHGSYWYVAVENGDCNPIWWQCTGKTGTDKILARAAVIALLRAKGVEVEFTK